MSGSDVGRTVAGLFIALLLGSCASTGLSGARADLSPPDDKAQQCLKKAGVPGGMQACTARSGPELAKTARAAFEKAQTLPDRANRVGYYVFAAQAGWESRVPEGLATGDAASQAGVRDCEGFTDNKFRPPRDCLLLHVAPGFIAHVRTLNTIADLEAKAPTALTPADRQLLAETSTNYLRRTFGFVENQRRDFGADDELDKSVLTMLDRQRSVFYCTALHLTAVDRRLGDQDSARELIKQRDGALTAVPELRAETCKKAT